MMEQRMLQDQPFTQSYAQAKLCFGDLGKALRILETHRENVDLGVSLYSLMTAVFQDWDIDNSAACLLFSSEEVVARLLRLRCPRERCWSFSGVQLEERQDVEGSGARSAVGLFQEFRESASRASQESPLCQALKMSLRP